MTTQETAPRKIVKRFEPEFDVLYVHYEDADGANVMDKNKTCVVQIEKTGIAGVMVLSASKTQPGEWSWTEPGWGDVPEDILEATNESLPFKTSNRD